MILLIVLAALCACYAAFGFAVGDTALHELAALLAALGALQCISAAVIVAAIKGRKQNGN